MQMQSDKTVGGGDGLFIKSKTFLFCNKYLIRFFEKCLLIFSVLVLVSSNQQHIVSAVDSPMIHFIEERGGI